MQKTKAIVLLIAASVLLVAVAGIAISQFVSAQTAGNTTIKHRKAQASTAMDHRKEPTLTHNNTVPNMERLMGTEWEWACADATGKRASLPKFLSLC